MVHQPTMARDWEKRSEEKRMAGGEDEWKEEEEEEEVAKRTRRMKETLVKAQSIVRAVYLWRGHPI